VPSKPASTPYGQIIKYALQLGQDTYRFGRATRVVAELNYLALRSLRTRLEQPSNQHTDKKRERNPRITFWPLFFIILAISRHDSPELHDYCTRNGK
jgi:hypothetical protein